MVHGGQGPEQRSRLWNFSILVTCRINCTAQWLLGLEESVVLAGAAFALGTMQLGCAKPAQLTLEQQHRRFFGSAILEYMAGSATAGICTMSSLERPFHGQK